jgi:site-specific DNA-methyltransferase (adenine-specific)
MSDQPIKLRAPRNRTMTLTSDERRCFVGELLRPPLPCEAARLADRIILGDACSVMPSLPKAFADLVVLDPPYNLTKKFGNEVFRAREAEEYERWFESWFVPVLGLLKPTASLYVCGDWRSSGVLQRVLERHVIVRNRITWEREKGRGAKANWKNSSEDIWFCTVSDDFHFDVDAVKLKRRVLAPYRENGAPKDWESTETGDFRLTHPSNLWTDLTVPFWSMPENTDHPTQKPEKLVAKLILASSRPGDLVFDPFLGSGTTAAVARKLGRRFLGIELVEEYALLSAKRVALAVKDREIQGYTDGVFWERNSLRMQMQKASASGPVAADLIPGLGIEEEPRSVSA